jgi:thioredoxin reductase (NADPH)
VVVGSKNSAAEAALDLYRHGARVTLVARAGAISERVKYWIKPDLENRIRDGAIRAHFNSRVVDIGVQTVTIEGPAHGQGSEIPRPHPGPSPHAGRVAEGPERLESELRPRVEEDMRADRRGPIEATLPVDAVFALIGYEPDFSLLERCGIRLEGEARIPVHDPETLESNVPGLYLAGAILSGKETGRIFIENSRHHALQIARSIAERIPAIHA